MKSFLLIILFLNLLWDNILLLQLAPSSLKSKPKKDEKNPLEDLSDAELETMMKKYGIDSKDLGLPSNDKLSLKKNSISKGKSSVSHNVLANDLNIDDDPLELFETKKPSSSPKSSNNINEIYNKNRNILNNYELSQRDAFNLIYLISNFNIFNRLPITAMNILNKVRGKKSFQNILNLHNNKTEEMNYLISNTLNSQVFIDHENRIGRKGVLTLIHKENAEANNVWAILNNKVFCFYRSSNYLNIIKIYRVSMLKIKDFIYTPCFFVYYDHMPKEDNNFDKTQTLICALNIREKEYWLRALYYHKEEYKELD